MKVEARLILRVLYETKSANFDATEYLNKIANSICKSALICGKTCAELDSFRVDVTAEKVEHVPVEFIVIFTDSTWEKVTHTIPCNASRLMNKDGTYNDDELNFHINRLIEQHYTYDDVVEMIPESVFGAWLLRAAISGRRRTDQPSKANTPKG